MNLTDIASIGELVSAIVLIISVVYLAIQVRQNTASQQTENYARAMDRLSAMQATVSRDDKLARLIVKGAADVSTLTPVERIQFTFWLAEAFGAFEFIFHQAQEGRVPGEVNERWNALIAFWLSNPGVVTWWKLQPAPFSTSFTAFVDNMIVDNPTVVEKTAHWAEFIQGKQEHS